MAARFLAARFWPTIALALAVLLGGEVFLQARTHANTGRSAVNVIFGQTATVADEALGIWTYRPGAVIKGRDSAMSINSLGLRSPEIPTDPVPGELRVAVIGASSVAGIYAPDNDATFSQRLAARLRQALPGRTVNVINAGVEGHALRDSVAMLTGKILPLRPDVVILYPGLNDVSKLCAAPAPARPSFALPVPALPNWALSRDMLVKNTIWLREQPSLTRTTKLRDPDKVDLGGYGADLTRFVREAKAAVATVVLATVARSFRPEMPWDRQMALSATARHYAPCFDLPRLYKIIRAYNDQIRAAAPREGAVLVDLALQIPGGTRYFVDANHFAPDGEDFVAQTLFDVLMNKNLAAGGRKDLAIRQAEN